MLTIDGDFCCEYARNWAIRYAASEKVQSSLQGCELIKLYVVYRGMEMAALDCIPEQPILLG